MLKSFATALTLASVALAGCTRTYTVAAGDICDSISKENKVSTFQLSFDNNGVDDVCSNLQIGQELCLGTDSADCTDVYVVTSGDTCSKIASAFSIDSSILLKNNPQIETGCTNIYVGEVLCVAAQAIAYPETVTITSETSPSYLASADAYEELPWCDEE
ncbi:Chitinase [Phaffia rhodozyma]|uniref:Chitinase n=1 Tax=Phaffia rhodozyma TaxID=264483 RepID=A0A0F7SHC3_PHARH|nr:Chitinase [Phaffia rhodozyma]